MDHPRFGDRIHRLSQKARTTPRHYAIAVLDLQPGEMLHIGGGRLAQVVEIDTTRRPVVTVTAACDDGVYVAEYLAFEAVEIVLASATL